MVLEATTTLVRIPIDDIALEGLLTIPEKTRELVLFVHGSGSSRHSPRNEFVAKKLQQAGLGTLLFDLLSNSEVREDELTKHFRFDILFLSKVWEVSMRLEPESVPHNVKVIFLGDRLLYYLLCAYDPEFGELFKVQADFEDTFPRSATNEQSYAELMATIIRSNGFRPFGRSAVARVIEHSARLASDGEKLSTQTNQLADLH